MSSSVSAMGVSRARVGSPASRFRPQVGNGLRRFPLGLGLLLELKLGDQGKIDGKLIDRRKGRLPVCDISEVNGSRRYGPGVPFEFFDFGPSALIVRIGSKETARVEVTRNDDVITATRLSLAS